MGAYSNFLRYPFKSRPDSLRISSIVSEAVGAFVFEDGEFGQADSIFTSFPPKCRWHAKAGHDPLTYPVEQHGTRRTDVV